jgi:hypothetical protein
MTIKDWNPNDYLFSFPDEPAFFGLIVNASLIHKLDKLIKYISTIYREILACYSKKAALAIILLDLAEVDYLTGYFVGHKTSGKDYKDFLGSKYFPQEYKPFIEDIYNQLRCGLLHNLVLLNPWHGKGIEFKITIALDTHLQNDKEGVTIFNPMTFATDINRAFIMYAYDLIHRTNEHPELVKNFERRFNRLGGLGAFMESTPD